LTFLNLEDIDTARFKLLTHVFHTGEPSEEACYADIDAAYDHLIKMRKLDPKQIVLYGRSVGSGPATYLAAKLAEEKTQIGGLILECPFKSVYRIVADFGCGVLGKLL
jgi:dienelactone hydrolase